MYVIVMNWCCMPVIFLRTFKFCLAHVWKIIVASKELVEVKTWILI